MLTESQFTRIAQSLPVLRNASPELAREFQQAAFLALFRFPYGYDVNGEFTLRLA